MRHLHIDPKLFIQNRDRLKARLMPGSLTFVNANDILPTNADGTLLMQPNSDLFYLTGIEQEESVLALFPDHPDESMREILFLREPNEHLKVWEGHKHSREQAISISGIRNIKWLSALPTLIRQLMCDADHVYLNSNEHKRAVVEVESRDARFINHLRAHYPLHQYHRLSRIMHQIRSVKSDVELNLLNRAISVTKKGFERVAKATRQGVTEYELEAEFIHEFTRNRCKFSYNPIIAAGENSCILHYNQNDQTLKNGDLLLLDVGANYANYNADLTRTIPVSGKFTARQRAVYEAVLRVQKASIAGAVVGKLHKDWFKESQEMMNQELLQLGLIEQKDIDDQKPSEPACRKYFMHGLGHVLGLDVHDVGLMHEPFAPGWVLTVEPGIYIPKEGFGIRLENNILVTENGPMDLMADIAIEPDDIEALMAQ
ncbi:MAG: aminopeptidase P family protein [Planctomycetota bacterium]|nr:MAG: aminopeptidase P family protein [Planctomycetota bacterium]